MTTTSIAARAVALSCVAALAIALTACGDGDEPSAGSSAASDTSTSTTASQRPVTDEDQIKAVIARVEQAFKTGDGQAICDAVTAAGKRDIVSYGRVVELRGSCVEIANGMVKRNRAAGLSQPPTKVVRVRVRGSRATAFIRVSGVAVLRQRYRKIGGEWKIVSLGAGDAALGGEGT